MPSMRFFATSVFVAAAAVCSSAADVAYNAPGAGNPILPGYFADPTIKKFGDTYYIYATTDGSGAGFGPAQLWQSRDLTNWTLLPMNWPDSHWIWAPDVMYNPADSLYYYIYCQPCQIHVGSSATPRGPWTNILGESEAVLVPDRFVTNAITLDGQTFVDDDGSIYMYWGTWGIYKGFGCGAGRLAPDMKTFTETRLIPNTEVTDFFEAPFVLKRNGKYYFMYSSGHCEDHTYRVQYAVADAPLGPYEYKGCILETNDDGTIHGPGHHSVLQDGDDYYILYHRHDNPHSNRGFHRQLAMDRLEFLPDGSIAKVNATHAGSRPMLHSVLKSKDLAFGKKVEASSAYDADFRPGYAVDNNNGTLWRPATMGQEWLTIDLGKPERIRTVLTQWEYGTQFYQYLIETSADGKIWEVFADKRANRLAGSPMSDFGDTRARYVRITFTGGQKAGFPGAIWNVKAFPEIEDYAPQQWVGVTGADFDGLHWANNEGQLGGDFALTSGRARAVRTSGRRAVMLEPNTTLTFRSPMISPSKPHTLTATVLRGGCWVAADTHGMLRDGEIEVASGADTLVIAQLRYSNWEKTPAEVAFDVESPVVRLPAAEMNQTGKVVDIDFSRFNPGDTVPYFDNGEGIAGYFAAVDSAGVIEEVEGRRALRFDGRTRYRSSFALPATLRDNAPYTLRAEIFNPTMELNECVADFTSSHDELEKIMLVNGTEPRCGLMQHYGWYEDAGSKTAQADFENRWLTVYVAFDGRMERVYINDRLVSEKDIQLLVKPSQFVTLGRNAEGDWPFTGLVGSITLWDEYIPKN